MLKTAASELLGMPAQPEILIDFKDLYTCLSNHRKSIDEILTAEINLSSFNFEVGNVDITR